MTAVTRLLRAGVASVLVAWSVGCTSGAGGGSTTTGGSTSGSGGVSGSSASAGGGGGTAATGGHAGSASGGGGAAGAGGAHGGSGGVATGGAGGLGGRGGTGGTGGTGGQSGGGGALDCGALVNCGGVCVDTTSDPSNCGGCGVVCAGVAQCNASSCACGTTLVSLATAVQPILDVRCGDCHTGPNSPQGLDLSAGMTHADTVGVPAAECNDGRLRVAPGDPANSYLVQKLLGVDLCQGDTMPKNGPPLSSSELQIISTWICQGADDN